MAAILTHGRLHEPRVIARQFRFKIPGWCRPEGDVAHQRLDLLARLVDVPARERGEAVHEGAVARLGVRQEGGKPVQGLGMGRRGAWEARPLSFGVFERLLRAGGENPGLDGGQNVGDLALHLCELFLRRRPIGT